MVNLSSRYRTSGGITPTVDQSRQNTSGFGNCTSQDAIEVHQPSRNLTLGGSTVPLSCLGMRFEIYILVIRVVQSPGRKHMVTRDGLKMESRRLHEPLSKQTYLQRGCSGSEEYPFLVSRESRVPSISENSLTNANSQCIFTKCFRILAHGVVVPGRRNLLRSSHHSMGLRVRGDRSAVWTTQVRV